MHAVPHDIEEGFPCNAYCQGEVHVDVEYAHPAREHRRGPLGEQVHRLLADRGACEVLAIVPAPEAVSCDRRYPENTQRLAAMGLAPEAWVAFRVTYRVHRREEA